jgi:hypothetical protein
MQTRRRTSSGFVEVALRSSAPELWGWDLRRDGGDHVLQRSEACYRHPEEAWKAGQTALIAIETALLPFAVGEEAADAA